MTNILISLGHGLDKRSVYDPGANGNGTTEASWLRGGFLTSLKKYAGNKIDFYEQNMFANREADTITGYDEVIELHLDAASSTRIGGHVIVYKGYKPDAMDNRLGNVIEKHFGLRGGKMFDGRNNLYNLNTFAKRKISYRLLELGFITNQKNMEHFKKHYDAIAKELIEAILNVKIDEPVVKVAESKKEGVRMFKPSTQTLINEMVQFLEIAHENGILTSDQWAIKAKEGTLTLDDAVALQATVFRRSIGKV